MIRIGIADWEEEYVKKLVRYLQKYGNGKWVVSGFTTKEDLLQYREKRMIDVLVCTDKKMLRHNDNGMSGIQLWLSSTKSNLEKIGEQEYVAYRFQSAAEIGRCLDRIIGEYKTDADMTQTWVAIYSPIGRCGKTTLAMEIVNLSTLGRWIYFGLEDYNSFFDSTQKAASLTDELLYFWKERKPEQVLRIIEQTEGFIVTGTSLLDARNITIEDVRWIKTLLNNNQYEGILFDIGSGVLKNLQVLQEFDVVIVPYLCEERALAKKKVFERLLGQQELIEDIERFWFVNMGDQMEINQVKRNLLGGKI